MGQFDNDPRALSAFINQKIRRIRRIRDIVQEEGFDQQAVETVQDIIRTSGRPTSNGIGRIDTGDMLNNVKSWVTSETDDHKTVAIGWQAADFADKRTPSYPVIQDQGFVHKGDPAVVIPGMEALDIAGQELRDNVVRAVRKRLRDRTDNQ